MSVKCECGHSDLRHLTVDVRPCDCEGCDCTSFSPAPTQAAGDGIELARAFYLKHSPSHGTVDIMAAFASEQTAPLLARIAELENLARTIICAECGERAINHLTSTKCRVPNLAGQVPQPEEMI